MSETLQPWYVIGHRNPDTDAICAAIGHAAFLRATGESLAQAACCGELTERTRLVVERAGLPAPILVEDVRATAGSICRRDVVGVKAEDTFMSAYRLMLAEEVRAVPVLNDENEVCGILRFLDLLQLLLPGAGKVDASRTIHVSLLNITRTLGANSTLGAPPPEEEADQLLLVGASREATVERRLQRAAAEGNVSQYVVICGDRPAVHQFALQYGAHALIITAGHGPDPELAERARERGMTIICSPHDTAMTVKLAHCARRVSHVLPDDYRVVEADLPVAELAKQLVRVPQEIFPVVAPGTRKLVGVFSKSDLVSPPRTRLSLVDHNEFSQAVCGVEEAEVVEVIDHHRLSGDFVTSEPVRFINEPVGSSSTIVARRFRERDLVPDAPTALCLAAGLVSDTLNLTSPTTTDVDRELLPWLADLAGVEPDLFASEFFSAGSVLVHGTAVAIVESDRKEFSEGGRRVSLSQIEELSLEFFAQRRVELEEEIERVRKQEGFDLVALLVTDIQSHESLLLAVGAQDLLEALEFKQLEGALYRAEKVVSRKKQLFPAVCRAIAKAAEV